MPQKYTTFSENMVEHSCIIYCYAKKLLFSGLAVNQLYFNKKTIHF